MSRYDEVEEGGGDIGRSLSQRIFLSDLLQGTGRFMGADQIEQHYLLSGSQNISLRMLLRLSQHFVVVWTARKYLSSALGAFTETQIVP